LGLLVVIDILTLINSIFPFDDAGFVTFKAELLKIALLKLSKLVLMVPLLTHPESLKVPKLPDI